LVSQRQQVSQLITWWLQAAGAGAAITQAVVVQADYDAQ
jgi:hypothetical protein